METEMNPWKEVVFANCDDDQCPHCKEEYAECDCIGPTEDDVEYEVIGDVLMGRRV
jgi:protein-disulfide isomerase